jgi:Kef-type K+ transport system membrane component KefB
MTPAVTSGHGGSFSFYAWPQLAGLNESVAHWRLWVGLALFAAMLSIRVGIAVALVEIAVGILAGNFLHLKPNEWVNFLASVGSVLLTFCGPT